VQGFLCRLDRAPVRACTSPAVFHVAPPGVHRLRIWAIDTTGHRDPFPATRYFRVGLRAPRR
jgi:hypothetical protein